MTVFSFLFSDQIARLLGARGDLLSLTSDYLRYYILFGIFFCMAMVLAAFVRTGRYGGRSFEQSLSRLAVYLCLSYGNPRSGRRFRSRAGNFLYDYASSFYSWERKAEAKASSYRTILHFRDPETGDTGTDHSDEPAGHHLLL